MERWMENKEIIIFYDDTTGVNRRSGKVIAQTDSFIFLTGNVAIPISRIVRIEMQGGGYRG